MLRHAALLPPHQVILSHQGEGVKSSSVWPEASFGQRTWVFWFLPYPQVRAKKAVRSWDQKPEASLELVEVDPISMEISLTFHFLLVETFLFCRAQSVVSWPPLLLFSCHFWQDRSSGLRDVRSRSYFLFVCFSSRQGFSE